LIYTKITTFGTYKAQENGQTKAERKMIFMSHKEKNLKPDPNTVNPTIMPTIPAAPPFTMPIPPGGSGTNANTSTQPETIKKNDT
jgi:hypothetical protein